MTELISYETTKAMLVQIADERPQCVIPQPCRYLGDGEPLCLIGVLLDRLGIGLEVLAELDREDPDSGPKRLSFSTHEVWRGFERKARSLMEFAQREQDGGRPWGGAVEYAIRREEG